MFMFPIAMVKERWSDFYSVSPEHTPGMFITILQGWTIPHKQWDWLYNLYWIYNISIYANALEATVHTQIF